MIRIRYYPLIVFTAVLLLAALACQTSTQQPAAVVDTEAIVRDVVATVEARAPEQISVTTGVPSVTTTQLAPLDTDLQSTLINVYRSVNPSVVHIFVFDDFNTALGSGSGFVYDPEGHIVTNNHVVIDSIGLEVVFPDGDRRQATVVGMDVDSDLAVIKVDSLPSGVQPVVLGDSSILQVGQFVIAIGNPFRETGSMTVGIVSGLGRTLESQRFIEGGGRYSLPQVIQTDAAINPGNSGGPLLTLQGEVIGVNSTIFSETGANSGVGFSIPVNAVKRVVPDLIAKGEYVYPYIGISMASALSLEELEALNLPPNGVYITSVSPDTPADAARLVGSSSGGLGQGLLPGGDYILAINGHPVSSSDELITYLIFETEVGQTVEFTVLRDGQEIAVPLTLGARP